MKNPMFILLVIIVVFSALIAVLVKSFHGEVKGDYIDNSKTSISTSVDNHKEDNDVNKLSGGVIKAGDISVGGN